MNTKNFIYLFFILLSFNQLIAGTGGSTYSRYGIGDLQYHSNATTRGMGGTAIANLSPFTSNRLNPAGWTQINRTRFSADLFFQGFSIDDGTQKSFLSGINYYGFDFAIPISDSNGIVIAAGLLPYSKVDYNIVTKGTFNNFNYDLNYSGEGGVSTAYIGGSYSPIPQLHFGAKFNYFFGNINHQIKQTFTSGDANSFELHRVNKLFGINGTAGVIYTGLNEILNLSVSEKINVGFLISTPSNLNAELNRYYKYYAGGNIITRDSILIEENKFKIPLALGLGVSYTTNSRYHFAADFYTQDWSKTKMLRDMPGTLKKNQRISAGAELLPLFGTKVSDFNRIGLRLGFYQNQTYYLVQNQKINELGFTAGIDFPIFGETRIAVAFDYSTRGTTSLQKDNIYRVSFGINGAELWFLRPEEE
ncbi:MAG: hypothetical protein Q8K98_04765 [Bacteroidota bacterium]|nr:hypothetical protein [Bacteroidota bacterium]